MELNDKDKRDGYIYDPIIKQYDTTFFKSTTGTPAMSSNVVRFNAAAAASYLLHRFVDIEFSLTIPTTPSGSESKIWGLRAPATDVGGAAYFEIAATVFKCVTEPPSGGTAQSTTVTWSSYEAVATSYRIIWEPDRVIFMVNGTIVATHTTAVPDGNLPIRIVNVDADNVDLTYIIVRNAAAIV